MQIHQKSNKIAAEISIFQCKKILEIKSINDRKIKVWPVLANGQSLSITILNIFLYESLTEYYPLTM